MTKIIADQKNLSECLQIANNGLYDHITLRFVPIDGLAKIRWEKTFTTMLVSVPQGWAGLEMDTEDVTRVLGNVFKAITGNLTREDQDFAQAWVRSIKAQAGI